MQQTRFGTYSPSDMADEPTRPCMAVPAQSSPAVEVIPSPRAAETVGEPRVVISRGPDAGASLAITGPRTTIGRHRDCDIVVDDVTVSRHHAELVQCDLQYVLVDGGSLNGTYLNRNPVDWAELADGDEIWIGKGRFTFHTSG